MKYRYKAIQDVMSVETLRMLIDYDPLTGELTWKQRCDEIIPHIRMTHRGIDNFNRRYAGKLIPTKTSSKKAYPMVQMILDGSKMTEPQHKIVWAIYYGVWPEKGKVVDHKDRDKGNNAISNLRLVTQTENLYNSEIRGDNTSGVTGVSYKKDRNKWKAYYVKDKKQYHLGYFSKFEDAVAARRLWEEEDDLFFVDC